MLDKVKLPSQECSDGKHRSSKINVIQTNFLLQETFKFILKQCWNISDVGNVLDWLDMACFMLEKVKLPGQACSDGEPLSSKIKKIQPIFLLQETFKIIL